MTAALPACTKAMCLATRNGNQHGEGKDVLDFGRHAFLLVHGG